VYLSRSLLEDAVSTALSLLQWLSHLTRVFSALLRLSGTYLMGGQVTVEPAAPILAHYGQLYFLQYPRRAATFLHTQQGQAKLSCPCA
jgi:hypothetical protein